MLLLITDPDQEHESFTLEQEEYSGYDIYQEVTARWGTDWSEYQVTEADTVRERVLNAANLR